MKNFSIITVSDLNSKTFLQNLCTANLNEITKNTWQISAFCTPQGKTQAIFALGALSENNYLILCPEPLSAFLLTTWQRFTLNQNIQLDKKNLNIHPLENKEKHIELQENNLYISGLGDLTMQALILHKFPYLTPEIQGKYLPQFFNLEENGGLSYQKGCYIGQEAIARAHYKSTINRHLYCLYSEQALHLSSGDFLQQDGQNLATIIQSAPYQNGTLALVIAHDHAVEKPLQRENVNFTLYHKKTSWEKHMHKNKITTQEKALRVNLDERKYGTIVEIGAGQEVARQFFRAGAAAGTIAKTMSAYDMQFSDAIYGPDPNRRYVSRNRVRAMIEREFAMVVERVKDHRPKSSTFFAYAATVAAKSFNRNNECHAWCGIRLQLYPEAPPSDIIVHVRMLDKSANEQQEALGVLGVNLIYGAYFHFQNPREIIDGLTDGLDADRLEIDSIEFYGPYFEEQDNRLLNLHLIRAWKTRAIIFNPEGEVCVPAELLYKKNVLVTRGNFKPFTLLNQDMMQQGMNAFSQIQEVSPENTIALAEIPLPQLASDSNALDDRDFIERVDQLSVMGYHVMISDYVRYFRLRAYFRQFTQKQIGIVLGMDALRQIFDEDFYRGVEGGVMEGLGKLFPDKTSVYAYPELNEQGEEITCENFLPPDNLKHLYQHLLYNHYIRPIHDSHAELFSIKARQVLQDIQENRTGWEKNLPEPIAELIRNQKLFSYNSR